jgi:subtilisin-like proprotein convertase family protein
MLPTRNWILGLLTASVVACASEDPSDDTKVLVIKSDVQDVSAPLSELAKLAARDTVEIRAHEAEPVRPIPHMRTQSATLQADPVVQSAFGGADIPTPIVSFEGMGTGMGGFVVQGAPPDTSGDIGPNHYVQIVNLAVSVFSRTGTRLLGPIATNTLWNGFNGACATTNDGDGVVRYDRMADRWVISQFSVNGGKGPFFECVAVSTTPDPTGSYNRYQFSFNAFNDYPKMGLWPDGYYFTFNIFGNGGRFSGSQVCAFDRLKMLAGQAATEQCFMTSSAFGGLLPSDLDGPTLPPAGSPNFQIELDTTTTLALFKMHVDFTTPANSTFTSTPTTINVASFNPLCGGGTCVVQPGTTNRLDSLADRAMNRLVYRNFSNHEALLVTHAVTAGTGGGVRFYELRNPAAPTVFQQGTYAPDNAFRWMSSAAFDSSGNIGMGFSISSSTINPSIRYTGRLATDPLGTMGQGEATIVTGTGSQINNLTRWGDYSSMNIDPTDDCTFWYTQEYLAANGSFNWRTRIGTFKFATCGNQVNDFSITVNPTSRTVVAPGSTTYTINTAVVSGNAQTIALSVSGLPAGVTGTFNPTSVTAGGSSTLTLTVAATAGAGTTSFTITGTGTSITHTATASITVTAANQAPTVTITSPLNGSTVSGTINVTATATDPDGTVASVRFDLPDGTSVTDTTAPFSTTFDTTRVANGPQVIRATATDNQGATGTTSVTVTVANNRPPTISITAPTNGSTVSGTIAVTATATDPDGTVASVRFDLPDGTSVTDTTAPFSTTFDSTKVVNGTGYVIRATATDNQGATAVASVTVTVANNHPPTVVITTPLNGSTVSGIIPVTATATDLDGNLASVKFDLPDGTSFTDTTAPFSTTFDSTTVANGTGYVIRATATDTQGATATTSVTISVSNCLDATFSATGLPLAIPDNDSIGITSSLLVSGNGSIASLSLSLSITHPFIGDLSVTLISPSGTPFSVSNRVGGSADNIVLTNLPISAFNGQTAAGTWRLVVQDLAPADVGSLVSWSLAVVGRCTAAASWSGSATPNLPTIDNGMACTSLTVATTGGDSSLAQLDISGNHDFRSVLRGTLTHNGVTVEAFPTGTFPTGKGTFSFAGRAVPGLSGDASGTWTFCIIDTDAFGDTGVLSSWSVHD